MVEKISVGIELEGGDKVESQLNDIGKTGNQAFAETAKAADRATESVSNFSLQTVKTSLEITKLTAEIAKVGVEIGLTIARHRSWAGELLHIASSANKAVRALALIAPELGVMGTALAAGTVALGAAAVAFEVVEKAATKAAKGYGDLNQSLKTLASNSGQSFDSLQRGRAAFEQLGVSGEKFAGIITKISEATASFDVGAKLKESADKALEAEKALLEAQLKVNSMATIDNNAPAIAAERLLEISRQLSGVVSDQAKAEEAASAQAKALANNLSAIIPLVQQIEAGQKGIKFDELTTTATKIDAVTASLKQAGDSGKTAGQVLVQFIANADRLSGVKVGAAFGITEADVDRIRNLGGQLNIVDDIWKRIQGAGVLIPPESAAAFDRMQISIDGADAAYARFQQSLQSSAFATLAANASSTLNDIKAGFFNAAAAVVETVNQVASAVSGVVANTRREFETLGEVLTSLGEALVKVFTDPLGALNDLIAGVQRLIDKFLTWLGLKEKGSSGGGGEAPGKARGGLIGGVGSGTSDSNLAWLSRGEHIMPASVVRQPGMLSFLESLRRGGGIPVFAEGGPFIRGTAVSRGSGITEDISNWIVKIAEANNAMRTALASLADAMTGKLFDVVNDMTNKLNVLNKAGFARGGLLGGRGTGTSDSNLAWLSRGEYVTPARAVAQPGVLGFLEALRRSGGNLSRVLDGMGHFALGGMVPRMPAFAAGGLAGGSHVTIQFPGLPAIGGLRASSDVVDQLHRAAALAQVRSGGRKPSRYS